MYIYIYMFARMYDKLIRYKVLVVEIIKVVLFVFVKHITWIQ